jgi:ankyrin repeat protein
LLAVKRSEVEICRLLVQAGANLYSETYERDTPMMLAQSTGNLELIKIFTDAGLKLVKWEQLVGALERH